MELKYIMPITGVLLGWLLSQLSGFFSLAREDRRLRSSSLPPMMNLYFQQYRIDKILEYFNYKFGDALEQLHILAESGKVPNEERGSIFNKLISNFEKTRQGNVCLPSYDKESLFTSVEKAVESLSKVDPTSAYKLSRLSSEFALMLEIKFPNDNLEPKHYFETHANMLSIFRTDIQNLRELILSTARRVSFVEYFKVQRLLRAEETQINDSPKEVVDGAMRSVKNKVTNEKMQNKPNKAN